MRQLSRWDTERTAPNARRVTDTPLVEPVIFCVPEGQLAEGPLAGPFTAWSMRRHETFDF
jgi:hypothetical protein